MANPSRSDQDPLDSIDPAAAEKAFERLRPRLIDIPAGSLAVISVDLQKAAIAALAVDRFVKSDAVRKRFLSLPASEFNAAYLDDLAPVALAAWHAAVELLSAAAGGSEAKLPLSLVEQATAVRKRMLTLVEYHLGDDPDEGKEIASIKEGTGYQDLANDLIRLAKLYKKHHAAVKLDPKHYVATDARDAKKLAQRIIVLLGDAANQDQKAWSDLVLRAWTLLRDVYAEVSAAGQWLFRREDGAKKFPSLYAVGRRAPGRPAKKKEGAGESGQGEGVDEGDAEGETDTEAEGGDVDL